MRGTRPMGRRAGLIAVAAAVALVGAGCANDDGGSDAGTASAGTSPAATATDGGSEVEMAGHTVCDGLDASTVGDIYGVEVTKADTGDTDSAALGALGMSSSDLEGLGCAFSTADQSFTVVVASLKLPEGAQAPTDYLPGAQPVDGVPDGRVAMVGTAETQLVQAAANKDGNPVIVTATGREATTDNTAEMLRRVVGS